MTQVTTEQAVHVSTSACWCDTKPTRDADYEFEDGSGFECVACGANVFFDEPAR